MQQGVGRLIRTQSDRGLIAILDVRAWTGISDKIKHEARMAKIVKDPNMTRIGYGKTLFDALGYTNIVYQFTAFQIFAKRFFNGS